MSKKVAKLYPCAWCGAQKTAPEMRHPEASRGKSSSVCYQCRLDHPGESWCDFHHGPHPVENFSVIDRPVPYANTCREAASVIKSQVSPRPFITCLSCEAVKGSWEFRGGSTKAKTCRPCEAANPGKRWCLGCDGWVTEELFNRTGVGGKFWTVRCAPCKNAHRHGVTVAEILRRQGSTFPECASCGSTEDLKVDHNHACCPHGEGCDNCVRGYLCHWCNTAEGSLKTPERARKLADYMERTAHMGVLLK